MALFSNIDLATAEVRVGALGATAKAKLAPIMVDGKPFRVQLATVDAPLTPLFPFRAYQDEAATRVSAVLRVPQELESWLGALEQKVGEQLVGRTDLVKQAGVKEVAAQLSSCVRQGQSAKFKLNKAGMRPCKVWNTKHEETTMPEDMRGVPCVPIAEARCLWMSGAGWGVAWEITDILILDDQAGRCPFA